MIAITAATGHTGSAAAAALLAKDETIRVIGRDAAKLEPFVRKGAEPFVANVQDSDAMTKAFEGAAAVYLVIPESRTAENLRAYQESVSDSYAAAVANSKVPCAVTLSSLGAQHPEKTGPIVGQFSFEQKINRIARLNVLHLRPAQFMENLLLSIPPLRSLGMFPGGANADDPSPWIATKDIGAYAARRLASRDFAGSSTQELFGPRDVSMKEIASIIGKAIGKPGVGYMKVPFMMIEPALVQIGMPKKTAALVIEMWKAGNSGLLAPQESRSAKNTMPTTIESFVTEVFVPAYRTQTAGA